MTIKIILSSFFIFLLIPASRSLTYAASSLSYDWHNDDNSLRGDFTYKYPLSINKQIFRFLIDGEVKLTSDNSLLRVIVIDNQKRERLVYEVYPLIVNSDHFTIKEGCEETCVMAGITPQSLRVEGFGALFSLNKITFSSQVSELGVSGGVQGIVNEIARLKVEQETSKIQKIKAGIQMKNQKWLAGKTSISSLTYEQKKKLFRSFTGQVPEKLPNLQGFEYYKGGIFEVKSDSGISPMGGGYPPNSNFRSSWDWRNVNGENWNTPVKNQGSAGTCWAHALIGAMETGINLYFNQRLNVDLSEQMMVDCVSEWRFPYGMNAGMYPQCLDASDSHYCNPGTDYCTIGAHGLSDEACDIYAERDLNSPPSCNADYICSDWQSRVWKVNDFHDYKFRFTSQDSCLKKTILTNAEELKKVLISKGPLNSAYLPWVHAMVLVGYGGQSDWKQVSNCTVNNSGEGGMCHSTLGCIPWYCNTPGEKMSTCVNDFSKSSDVGAVYNFVCEEFSGWNGHYRWKYKDQQACGTGKMCQANSCQDKGNFQLTLGYKECTNFNTISLGGGDMGFWELSEYAPGRGENYWIFKNSWGANWGENGYVRLVAPLLNIGWASLPIGPYIPPTNQSYWPIGFENQIKCEDKDHDGYCTWGVSETKPASCPSSCKPEKDCDDSNPNLGPFDQNMNCIQIGSQPTLISGWNKINWPTFEQGLLPLNCSSYSYLENNLWRSRTVSYGLPLENLLGQSNFSIKCR